MSEAQRRFSGPNVTIECKSKAAGQAFNYGDEFIFKLDMDKSLDDGNMVDVRSVERGFANAVIKGLSADSVQTIAGQIGRVGVEIGSCKKK